MASVAERLLSRRQISENGCWIWTGSGNTKGYGKIKIGGRQGKLEYVHIVAYRLWVGEIPDGYEVDHVLDRGCVSRACFNPEHLEAVTVEENRNRSTRWSDVCDRGHRRPGGRGECMECRRARGRKRVICEICTKEVSLGNLPRHKRTHR